MTRSPRIYITGASCAGVTTLGAALAARLSVPQFDVDAYYWLPTEPPFTQKRPPQERLRLIAADMAEAEKAKGRGWVLTGSFDGWGDALVEDIDLIAFVTTPTPLRMERLKARERERFGDRIDPGGDMHEIHVAFADWASRYDEPGFSGRNRARHEAWLVAQTAPVLRLDGSRSVEELVEGVVGQFRVPEGARTVSRYPNTR
ncbi:AAA family ATPase [Stappia sp. MMSF_3263]|uniref:ATP-binding protein n=1 Tax=Stappia sp. MMSF_3263 TaxID=3046693 RepID=UPI00273F8A0E|nr:AAA family ATPase [Stappia sp. MMSF_3263]